MNSTETTLTPIRIYEPGDIHEIIENVLQTAQTVKTNKKRIYYNIPCSFDIETTSFYNNKDKRAIMYEWTLNINDFVIIGRKWGEFIDTIQTISDIMKLQDDKRLIIYVHNLSFEFQFIRKRFTWLNVFSLDTRKPVYAVTDTGIEFRCSYILSGYGLAGLGEQLHKYPVQKMVGDLDYKLKRNSMTPLSEKELMYCVNDTRVVVSYIREQIEYNGDITKIPLTKTGYVRTYCRNACMYTSGSHKKGGWKYIKYSRLMESLRLRPEEYEQLKRAFQGGFTHANAFYTGKIVNNVGSYDFTSSYPAVMCAEKFPMSPAESIIINDNVEFIKNLNLYCCLFDIKFMGLESITTFEHPISESRCYNVKGATIDNGRIVCADELKTTLTEQDFFIIRKFYKWQKILISNFRRYKRGYLPTDFVKAILELYEKKTTLKNVDGAEDEYLRSKEMINSAYGMCVTDICRDSAIYDGDWRTEKPDISESIDKYNKSKKRFLYYPWGVWVTAYARKNLFTGIYEFGNDYLYSDTDSVKGVNIERHKVYIDRYNKNIIKKLETAMQYHGIAVDKIRPKTIQGKEKILGVWDFEGIYSRFKTLGAKRYMTEKNGEISITVSGVNKKKAVPYLNDKYKNKIFEKFDDDLHIPEEFTGKNTHTYIDEEVTGIMTDYLGNSEEYHEYSSTHLEGADYRLSLSESYVDYLMGIKEFNK